MSKTTKPLAAITLAAFALAAGAPALAATPLNSFLCKSSNYACTNQTYAGDTGYAGYDGPYGYDTDKSGAHIAHNCTSYIAYRFHSIMGYYDSNYNKFGDAADWDVNVPRYVPNASIGSEPYVGDIAQWNFGHVAWVDFVHYDASYNVDWIVVSDDNYGLKITSQRKIYANQKSGVISWPDHFIGLPIYWGGGGGTPPIAMSQPIAAP